MVVVELTTEYCTILQSNLHLYNLQGIWNRVSLRATLCKLRQQLGYHFIIKSKENQPSNARIIVKKKMRRIGMHKTLRPNAITCIQSTIEGAE